MIVSLPQTPPPDEQGNLLVDSCVFIDSFDPKSPNYADSLILLEELAKRRIVVMMPAHGWFEVQCTLQRLRNEGRFVGPTIRDLQQYVIKLIHIDQNFIAKYAMVDLPYIKAGDHIFLAVAKLNGRPLVTSDTTMIRVARAGGIAVFTPKEALIDICGGGA
jgi:predicted nucleic acid-binding protein